MGGAERAERKRKQQAARAAKVAPVATGADKGARRRTARVVLTVLLALVAVVGIWLQYRSAAGDLPATVPIASPGPEQTAAHADSVTVGKADAPVSLDVYEDFLCTACGQFEQLYGDQLRQAATAGQARIVYHPVAILDAYSDPTGYSTLAAGVALCAAEANVFPRFHDSLFATQPREGGTGWTRAQLQQLGTTLGAGDSFVRCVQADDQKRVAAATDEARQYLSKLRPDGRLGTPTILVNGALANTSTPDWLDGALGAAR